MISDKNKSDNGSESKIKKKINTQRKSTKTKTISNKDENANRYHSKTKTKMISSKNKNENDFNQKQKRK